MELALALLAIVHWMALSSWFGSAVFVAVAAPIVFRTVRENDPTLPLVLSVNLESQHATLLAGEVMSNLLTALSRVGLLCSGALLLAVLGEWLLIALRGGDLILPFVRTALLAGATGLAVYDWRVVRPRVEGARREYVEHADEPERANAARERFDHYHRESVTVLQFMIFALLGLVLFGALGLAIGGGVTYIWD